MRKALYFISPGTIAMLFLLIIVLNGLFFSNNDQGWGKLAALAFLPALILMVLTVFLSRLLSKGNIAFIWIWEIFSVLSVIAYFVLVR